MGSSSAIAPSLAPSAAPSPAPAITPVYEILTPQELRVLRRAYEREPAALANFVTTTYNGLYPPGSTIFNAIGDRFYLQGNPPRPPQTTLSQRDREVVLIPVLTLRQGSPVPLSAHIYWGLMVGLDPREIGELMLLTGVYNGIDAYTVGLGVLASTLETLKDAVATGATSPLQIIAALSAAAGRVATTNMMDGARVLERLLAP
jgi:alkylhydroperoxidase/carboxymuconolactone decarboxylase family protein YurZ